VERLRIGAFQVLTLAGLLALWEISVRAGWVDPLFVPAPSAVGRTFVQIFTDALPRLGDTFAKTLIAYVLSVGLGVSFGLVVGSVRHLHDVLNPYLVVLYGIPKILVLPWIILISGMGVTPALVYATLHGFFPVALLVIGGVRDVDRTLITVARSMGASPGQIYRKVMLPAVLPSVLSGMKIAIVFCLLGVLIVEMFAGIRGMGFLLGSFANQFAAAKLFAATALLSVLSIAVVLGLEALNSRLGRWRA
jgi:NitT/TauT family transport system permease protein